MTPIRLLVERNCPPTAGKLLYSHTDLAFDFEPLVPCPTGLYSLVIGSLQLDVSMESGIVLYPWGYSPYMGWSAGSVDAPADPLGAAIRAELLEGLPPRGAGIGLPNESAFTRTYDEGSGWIRFALESTSSVSAVAVEFASNCIMEIFEGMLVGLYLHPEWE